VEVVELIAGRQEETDTTLHRDGFPRPGTPQVVVGVEFEVDDRAAETRPRVGVGGDTCEPVGSRSRRG
jgi:hypothetical protein